MLSVDLSLQHVLCGLGKAAEQLAEKTSVQGPCEVQPSFAIMIAIVFLDFAENRTAPAEALR
jgi:hypothetical protein